MAGNMLEWRKAQPELGTIWIVFQDKQWFDLCRLHLFSVPSKSIIIWSILSCSTTDTSWGNQKNKLGTIEMSKTTMHREHSQSGNYLTWPTSAGAIVELMCSTAWETPATETLVGLRFCNVMGKSCKTIKHNLETHAICFLYQTHATVFYKFVSDRQLL